MGANRRLAWTTILLSHKNRRYCVGATFRLRDPSKSNSGAFFVSAYFRHRIDCCRIQLLAVVCPKLHLLAFQILRCQKRHRTKLTPPLDVPSRIQQTNMVECSSLKVSRFGLLALTTSRGRQKRIRSWPQYGDQYRMTKT